MQSTHLPTELASLCYFGIETEKLFQDEVILKKWR